MTKTSIREDLYRTSKARVGRIQDLVCQLGRLLESVDTLCLASLDITVSQGYSVMALPRDGVVGMGALGEALGVAPSTATRMVDQLVAKRLVERRSAPEDRRAVRVALTPRGQELRRQLGKATASCFLGALDKISREQQSATIEALELVIASLREFLETGTCAACDSGTT
jgi:DNA-binding MarR family transcriptional regulator